MSFKTILKGIFIIGIPTVIIYITFFTGWNFPDFFKSSQSRPPASTHPKPEEVTLPTKERPEELGESSGPVPIQPTKTQQRVQAKDFVFELKDCKAGGQTVSCLLTITNRGRDRDLFICGKVIPWPLKPGVKKVTRMFDDSGNEYVITAASLANKTVKFGPYEYCVSSLLVSGIPTVARLNFDNVLQGAGVISLLEMSLVAGHEEDFLIQFRNIPLTR